jgi:hypothetical protein
MSNLLIEENSGVSVESTIQKFINKFKANPVPKEFIV